MPFTLYFLRKEGRKPSGDLREDPHPHRQLKSGTPSRVSVFEVKACGVRLSHTLPVAKKGVADAKGVPT